MKVDQVMQKEVRTVHVEESLNAAARLMWEHDCGCVPVMNDASEVVAMLTDRDVCMAAYTQGKPLWEIPVKTAMSKGVISCSSQDTVAVVEKVMQTEKVRRLPVLDPGRRLVGIISLHDIAREAVRQKDVMGREVTDEEVGRTLSKICQSRRPEMEALAGKEKEVLGLLETPRVARTAKLKAPKPPALLN